MHGLPEIVECWKAIWPPPTGILRYTTFRAGERPMAGWAMEELWTMGCPDCKCCLCVLFSQFTQSPEPSNWCLTMRHLSVAFTRLNYTSAKSGRCPLKTTELCENFCIIYSQLPLLRAGRGNQACRLSNQNTRCVCGITTQQLLVQTPFSQHHKRRNQLPPNS